MSATTHEDGFTRPLVLFRFIKRHIQSHIQTEALGRLHLGESRLDKGIFFPEVGGVDIIP